MNEKVLAIERKNLPSQWLGEKTSFITNTEAINNLTAYIKWHDRSDAEHNEQVKQIIPYMIISDMNDDTIAVYRRAGNERRLHGLYSVGVGGHINPEDALPSDRLLDIVVRSAQRELSEELTGLDDACLMDFLGVINEERTRVGRTHTGLVFRIQISTKPGPGAELTDFHWSGIDAIIRDHKIELWSEMALKLLK